MKRPVFYFLLLFVHAALAQDTTYVCFQQDIELSSLASLNTKFIEFSPTYYENGIVFVVARERNRLFDPKTGQAYFDLMYADVSPDGTAGKPVNFSPNIRTQYHEGPSVFSSDGNEIFFTRSALPTGDKSNAGKDITLRIFHATRGAEDWENITELPFSSALYSAAHPALSPDGRYLVFASDMPGGSGGMDLYITEKNKDHWTTPVNLGSRINSSSNEVFPFWHRDGYLFYSSDRSSGYGGLDIYVTGSKTSEFTSGIQHLEFPFNSGRDDLGFIVSPDGMSGYFASDRKPTQGKDDLYTWSSSHSIFCVPPVTEPVLAEHNLLITDETGEAVSQAYIWLIPMTSEGPSLFRDRFMTELVPDPEKSGSFSLQWGIADTLSRVTASAMTKEDGYTILHSDPLQNYMVVVQHKSHLPFIKVIGGNSLPAKISLQKTPAGDTACLNTLFTIYNAEGSIRLTKANVHISGKCLVDKMTITPGTDGDLAACIPSACPVNAEISHEGYAPHSFTFTPSEENEHWTIYLKSSEGLTSPAAPIASGTIIVLDNIYYDFNKSAIRKSDAGELQALADILKKYPDLTIELTSHTDTRGTAEYNMELSERRSESSKSYLVLLGINPARITTKAAGESQPRNRCTDDVPCSEAEHQYNRRTEVRITNPAQGMEVRYKRNDQ